MDDLDGALKTRQVRRPPVDDPNRAVTAADSTDDPAASNLVESREGATDNQRIACDWVRHTGAPFESVILRDADQPAHQTVRFLPNDVGVPDPDLIEAGALGSAQH